MSEQRKKVEGARVIVPGEMFHEFKDWVEQAGFTLTETADPDEYILRPVSDRPEPS